MNRLFGAKTAAPKPTLQGAITNLDTRLETIDVQLTKINAELSTYQQRMAKMREGPGKNALRQKAMKVLQRRKMYESQKEQIEQQSWNMQQAGMMQDNLKSPSTFSIFSVCILLPQLLPRSHFTMATVAAVGTVALAMIGQALLIRMRRSPDVMVTVDAMKTTNKELKKQYGKIDIDKIDKMQDEMADLMDIGNDIQESISRSYDVPDEVDESELDAELEALGDEIDLGGGWEAESSTAVPSFLEEPAGVPDFLDEPPTAAKVKEAV
ncbi:Snf7-domain-containing protein [Geopyxis carbonaria]|nr:Snf7-domain-containing protein [Geopyxis carbonaria]